MNFEKIASNYDDFNKTEADNVSDAEKNYKKAISRRDLLENAAAAFISSVSFGGVYFKNNKENEIADTSSRLDDIEKRMDNLKLVSPESEVAKTEESQEIIEESTMENNETRETISSAEFKKLRPDLSYEKITPELKIENLNLLGKESKFGVDSHEGKILRTLRFKNITDAIEDRYNLPSGVLMAMVMQESTGIDLLPNSSGDGGFGLCHMQGSTASDFNLKTFHECNSLVCNSVRGCKNEKGEFANHAEQLKQLMKDKKDDRLALVNADDRLHFILNLDAAGRMLASYMSGPKLKGELSGINSFETAIARYAGKDNFRNYLKKVTKNMEDLKYSNVIDEIAENFNAINPDLKVNGEPADFYAYIAKFQEQHADYGLEEYKKLPKYNPKNSDEVLKTFS